MNLARHSISSTSPVNVFDARFDADCNIFAATTSQGFGIYKTWPLRLLRKRDLAGTLSKILPLHASNIVFLVGGGRDPRYPPNKVVFWDEAAGKEVVELEFKEQVRGIACRRNLLAVALKRRVITFDISSGTAERKNEWETCENERGLIALATAPGSTLMVIPGRQIGHVRLIHLPPCEAKPLTSPPPDVPPDKGPSRTTLQARDPAHIIMAHDTPLTTLALPPSGRLVSTTSVTGTLVRVWDAVTGKLVRELRRGSDNAVIYGVAFRPDETEVAVWSDKGTIHLFKLTDDGEGLSNRQSALSSMAGYLHKNLSKYLSSQWSYARYRLPSSSKHITLSAASGAPPDPEAAEEEKCSVGWIEVPIVPATPPTSPPRPKAASSSKIPATPTAEFQLVALTYSGGWYRLAPPSATSALSGSPGSPVRDNASTAESSRRLSATVSAPRSPTATSPGGKGKERNRTRTSDSEEARPVRKCTLVEFKRFGRWDGWV